MFKITYDYKTNDGVLETESVYYKELKLAIAFAKALKARRDVVGKPMLESL